MCLRVSLCLCPCLCMPSHSLSGHGPDVAGEMLDFHSLLSFCMAQTWPPIWESIALSIVSHCAAVWEAVDERGGLFESRPPPPLPNPQHDLWVGPLADGSLSGCPPQGNPAADWPTHLTPPPPPSPPFRPMRSGVNIQTGRPYGSACGLGRYKAFGAHVPTCACVSWQGGPRTAQDQAFHPLPSHPPPPLSGKLSCRCTPQRAQVSAGVSKASMDSECASGCTWSTARAPARLRDSRPRSSQTGQVIQGLR